MHLFIFLHNFYRVPNFYLTYLCRFRITVKSLILKKIYRLLHIYYLDFSFFYDPKTKELEPIHWKFVNNLVLKNEIVAKLDR